MIGQISQGRAVFHVQHVDESEDQIGIGCGVGHDHVGALPAVLAVHHIDHVQGIAGRPGGRKLTDWQTADVLEKSLGSEDA